MIKCYCGFESNITTKFIWTYFKHTDRVVLICEDCADRVHKKHIAEGVE